MRRHILEHMRRVPMEEKISEHAAMVWFLVHPSRFLLPAIASFILLAGGVSYAAEWSMPTDTLYPIKVLVNEPLFEVLSFTDEAKAHRGVERVARRLNEAITLAATHRLDAHQSALIHTSFVLQTGHAEERIRSLLRRGLEGPALEVLTTFEASLRAHGMTLADVVGTENDLASMANDLIRAVDTEQQRIAASGNAVASRMVAEGPGVDGAVQAARRATQVHLKHMQVTAGDLPTLRSQESARIDASVRSAKLHLSEANARLDAGDAPRALEAVKEGLRWAESAELLLEVEEAKVGRSRGLPDWNLRFVPETPRSLREQTEVHQERERVLQEKKDQ